MKMNDGEYLKVYGVKPCFRLHSAAEILYAMTRAGIRQGRAI